MSKPSVTELAIVTAVGLGLLARHHAVVDGGFDGLLHQLMGRIEGGGGRLRHIGDARAPERTLLGLGGRPEVNSVEDNGPLDDAAAGPGKAHGGESEGRLASARFAHQAQDFPGFNTETHLVQGLEHRPALWKLDAEVANFKQCHGATSLQAGIERVAHSPSPYRRLRRLFPLPAGEGGRRVAPEG